MGRKIMPASQSSHSSRLHLGAAFYPEHWAEAHSAGVLPVMDTPRGVEARKRTDAKGGEVFILVNHERVEHLVQLSWPAREHLSGRSLTNQLKFEPYDVAVLTRTS
jgi:beta-galactosidase GanA